MFFDDYQASGTLCVAFMSRLVPIDWIKYGKIFNDKKVELIGVRLILIEKQVKENR